ncbi:hypothetical protein CEXT_470131 [Caerostris extrusa]|uniref:Uncharacterized protein n=1 Tax=Caerostris extrusa TaxID=172846 RepID=A0AAV4MPV5_CAEEX|nr:hypothetical protein CEXT_470131 [Caerostris extrusa]
MSSVCLEGECLPHSRAAAVIQSDGNTNPNQYPDRSRHRYWSPGINSVAHTGLVEIWFGLHSGDRRIRLDFILGIVGIRCYVSAKAG